EDWGYTNFRLSAQATFVHLHRELVLESTFFKAWRSQQDTMSECSRTLDENLSSPLPLITYNPANHS
ncbi:MAG TPA: hypothetical protein V6D48_24555, partial [Oculatellaceae cyanobacterium]